VTTPTPQTEPEHPPDDGLTPRDRALLMAHGQRPEQQPAERPDYEALVRGIADRARPHRDRRDRERTARQARIDELRTERRVEVTLATLDRRFARFTATRPEHPAVMRACIAMRRGQLTGLVLRGRVGTGKTHEAVAAYRWLVAHGTLPAVAVAVPALLDGLRPGRDPVESLAAVEDARVLLLDDLAAERATDWTAEVLYRVIDARYARALPTIVTTNATAAMIREGLGDRIASRLNGLGMIVTLDGPDRRTPTPAADRLV